MPVPVLRSFFTPEAPAKRRLVVRTGPDAEVTIADNIGAIVIAARSGNLIAQSELVHRFRRRLAGFLKTIVLRRSDLDELVQVTFIKMSRQLHVLRDSAQFESWIFTLARNTAIDHIRRLRRERTVIVEEMPGDFAKCDKVDGARDILEAFEIALAHISPLDRTLLKMRIHGDSYQIIAATTGLCVPVVKGRLCRVRPRLKLLVAAAGSTSYHELEHLKRGAA